MLSIGLSKMKQWIRFSKRIYTREALQMAVNAFCKDFQIAFATEDQEAYTIDFTGGEDLEEIIGEFNNYVIRLENRGGVG